MKTNFSIDKAAESWLRDSRLFYNVGMATKDSIPCFPSARPWVPMRSVAWQQCWGSIPFQS